MTNGWRGFRSNMCTCSNFNRLSLEYDRYKTNHSICRRKVIPFGKYIYGLLKFLKIQIPFLGLLILIGCIVPKAEQTRYAAKITKL